MLKSKKHWILLSLFPEDSKLSWGSVVSTFNQWEQDNWWFWLLEQERYETILTDISSSSLHSRLSKIQHLVLKKGKIGKCPIYKSEHKLRQWSLVSTLIFKWSSSASVKYMHVVRKFCVVEQGIVTLSTSSFHLNPQDSMLFLLRSLSFTSNHVSIFSFPNKKPLSRQFKI